MLQVKHVLAITAFVIASVTQLAIADVYKLAMSKEDAVCNHMINLFNEDLKIHGKLKYEQHVEFSSIGWTKVFEDYCDLIYMSEFDINDDGQIDTVVKNAACLSNEENDVLYVYDKGFNAPKYPPNFKLDATMVKQSSGVIGSFPKGSYYLKKIPKFKVGSYEGFHYLGSPFLINPFRFRNKTFIAIDSPFLTEDGGGKKFIVITKYKH